MKTHKLFNLIVLMTIVVMTTSCSSDSGIGFITPPTPAAFNDLRNKALDRITQTHTFNAESGTTFTSTKGAVFSINPNQISLNGVPVVGPVKLEFVELYKRGEMLVVNKPLMGTAIGGEKGPMKTGGQFYVNITKDGVQVDPIHFYKIIVPAENTGNSADPNMTLWIGKENENNDMIWDEENDQERGGVFGEPGQYNLLGCHFGWINIDILYNLPGPKTEVWVKVPEGFDNKNSAVYVAYKNQVGSLAYMDIWNTEKKMFTEHYGLAPIGFNFYVIFVSAQENNFIYDIQDVTVEANKIITFDINKLKGIDELSLIALINYL